MNKKPKQRTEHQYPPTKELWSVFGIALGGGIFWVLANFVRNISLQMLDDPIIGCSAPGCAPGLVNFASLFLYLVAILCLGFSYLGLMTFVRRPLAATMMVLGILGILIMFTGLVTVFDNRIVGTIGLVVFLSGILAYVSS